jgi:hypothetical protein
MCRILLCMHVILLYVSCCYVCVLMLRDVCVLMLCDVCVLTYCCTCAGDQEDYNLKQALLTYADVC